MVLVEQGKGWGLILSAWDLWAAPLPEFWKNRERENSWVESKPCLHKAEERISLHTEVKTNQQAWNHFPLPHSSPKPRFSCSDIRNWMFQHSVIETTGHPGLKGKLAQLCWDTAFNQTSWCQWFMLFNIHREKNISHHQDMEQPRVNSISFPPSMSSCGHTS